MVLRDGRTLSGIVRETPDGLNLTVLDAEGKPQTVGRSDVEEVIAGNVSLMPDNVASLLSEQDLVNLAHWLMQ